MAASFSCDSFTCVKFCEKALNGIPGTIKRLLLNGNMVETCMKLSAAMTDFVGL